MADVQLRRLDNPKTIRREDRQEFIKVSDFPVQGDVEFSIPASESTSLNFNNKIEISES